MFRGTTQQRIIFDFTQGDEPVVSVIQVPVTPAIVPEVPAYVPLTLDSPEYLRYVEEEHVVIRNSCA